MNGQWPTTTGALGILPCLLSCTTAAGHSPTSQCVATNIGDKFPLTHDVHTVSIKSMYIYSVGHLFHDVLANVG